MIWAIFFLDLRKSMTKTDSFLGEGAHWIVYKYKQNVDQLGYPFVLKICKRDFNILGKRILIIIN